MPRLRRPALVLAAGGLIVALAWLAAPSSAHPQGYALRPLVASPGLPARAHDPQLVNAWGLAASPTGPWWTANEASGSSTLYAADGHKQALTVSVPCGPTGIAYYGGGGFVVRGGGRSAPARFLYACEDGTIRAWAPTVPHGWSAQTAVAVDRSGSGAVFRGLAFADGRLYAADFHSGRVLVFDDRWRQIDRGPTFRDPSLPSGYAPFGILARRGRVFVTYAWRAPVDGNDAPTGGYVDEYDAAGRLLGRIGRGIRFDEPWGLALAPPGFGALAGDLLVANFGSGRIESFQPRDDGWIYSGTLDRPDGHPLLVPGVWGIAFGNGGEAGSPTTLFAAAGPHRWHGASELAVRGLLAAISPAR